MTAMPPTTHLGIDPGGQGAFGLALLAADGGAACACVSSVDEALAWLSARLPATADRAGLVGVGIDAPLWWSTGPGGTRDVDRLLRAAYGLSSGQVQAVNSLRGAAVVQGPLLACCLRQRCPHLTITETHPKALLRALGLDAPAFFAQHGVTAGQLSEHERDALISAAAVRAGLSGRWPADLAADRPRSERDVALPPLGEVRYYWPEWPRIGA